MPPLRLTDKLIEKACELRAYGGSDAACARHARVTPQTFNRWVHYGQILRDYMDDKNTFHEPDYYRTFQSDAKTIIDRLKTEIQIPGRLAREHRRYLKLWDKLLEAQDAFVVECHQTIDKFKSADPTLALKALHWFYPDEYRDVPSRTEMTGKDGGPIQHEDMGLTDAERVQRVAELLAQAQKRQDKKSDGQQSNS